MASIRNQRHEQPRTELREQRPCLPGTGVEHASRANALAEVQDNRREPGATLGRRAPKLEGHDPLGVELRPAAKQGALAQGQSTAVETVAELPVTINRQRHGGSRQREPDRSDPPPAQRERNGSRQGG